jgi:CubicO group peptidase (beta-lactamase class C family)
MYGVAGVLGERITGASWHKNLSNMIFEPLSLDRTFSNVEEASLHSNFSIGYAVDASNIVPVLPEKIATRAPAGDVFSSVEDMAEWLKVWLNEGKHNGIQFLSPSYIESATSEVQLMNPATDSTSARHYGYGWMRSEFHGRKRVEHSGGVSGYSANMVLFPDDKLGIVVLVNQTGSGLAGHITEKFIAKLLDVEALDAADEPESRYFSSHTIEPANTPTTLKSNSPTTVDLVAFEGSYFHPGFGQIDVIYDGNTLFAEFPFKKMRLEHQGGNLYFDHLTEEIPLMYWNFMRLDFQETNGTVNGILINFQADPVHFVRMKT